jgi:hypothetical protein
LTFALYKLPVQQYNLSDNVHMCEQTLITSPSVAQGTDVISISLLIKLLVGSSQHRQSSTSRYLPVSGRFRICWWAFHRERLKSRCNPGGRGAYKSVDDSGLKADSNIACCPPTTTCVNLHMPCRAPALLRQCHVLRVIPRGRRKYRNC